MDKQEIKELLIERERTANGLDSFGCVGLSVLNLRLTKTLAKYDLVIEHYEDGVTERYDECEYPLDKIGG